MVKEEVGYFRELGVSGRNLTPSSFVGLSTLPDQFVNLQLKRGFCFNVMCIGATGVGKTSLLHALFGRPFHDDPHPSRSEEVSLVVSQYDMKEANVNLKVTFIESRGYGDQVNKTSSADNIIKYIDDQYQSYLNEETKIKRNLIGYQDKRVHACLYMISPTGHSLNALDIMTMRILHRKVNLIPVIGKADILTKSELKEFKARINKDLRDHGIQIYNFPVFDQCIKARNSEMNERMPFAVVASTEEETVNNQTCRVRRYPWGTVVIDDDHHCEFQFLRDSLLRWNLFDLIRDTHDKFYEEFRLNVYNNGGIQIDAEMTQIVAQKNSEIKSSSDREADQLQRKFEADKKALEDKYRIASEEIENDFNLKMSDFQKQKESVSGSCCSKRGEIIMGVSQNRESSFRDRDSATRTENIVRELRRFRGVMRQYSKVAESH